LTLRCGPASIQKPGYTQHSPIQQFVEEIAETDRVLRVLLTKMSKLALLAPEGYTPRARLLRVVLALLGTCHAHTCHQTRGSRTVSFEMERGREH
jgi:hypothetical protein